MPERFGRALALLPDRLRQSIPPLCDEERARVEEIRLRAGQPVVLTIANAVRCTQGPAVEEKELELLLQRASKWSVHTVLDQLCGGYMTVEGGYRIGVVGTAVMDGTQVRTVRDVSGVNIRVARQIKGCASDIALQVCGENMAKNTLVIAPAGGGKTTVLRDLIRLTSLRGLRVSVADERGELAAAWQGAVQMDLGPNTDVLSGCPKSLAIQMLLRGMNPQVIAVDEITAPEDVRAMELAVGCGVSIFATAHAQNAADLQKRPVYRTLLQTGLFETLVVLSRQGDRRLIRLEEIGDTLC